MREIITTQQIEAVIRETLKVDIYKKTRTKDIVEARAIYYYLCDKYTLLSLSDIGATVGKGHATVIHGLKKLKLWRELYYDYNRLVENCEGKTKYIINLLYDRNVSIEDALSSMQSLEEENKRLLQDNIVLTLELQELKAEQKKQNKYLIEMGYKPNMSRVGMKYNKK